MGGIYRTKLIEEYISFIIPRVWCAGKRTRHGNGQLPQARGKADDNRGKQIVTQMGFFCKRLQVNNQQIGGLE